MKRACTFSSGNIVLCLCIAVVFFLFAHQAEAQEESNIYEVDILWSTNTTTPKLYEGKALFGIGGTITAHALVHNKNTGEVLDPQDFEFIWKFKDLVVGNASGIGQDTYTLSPLPQKIKLSVEVRQDRLVIAKSQTTITPTIPEIVFYENRPLLGSILESAFNKRVAFKETLSVVAEPYYFAPSALIYTWLKDSKEIAKTRRNTASFESSPTSAITNITVDVQNEALHSQRARNEIELVPLKS